MTAALASGAPHLLLHRFILRRPPLPLSHSVAAAQVKQPCFALKMPPSFFPSRPPPRSLSLQLATDVTLVENAPIQWESETNTIAAPADSLRSPKYAVMKAAPPPTLSIKEKKELASYAQGLGKKLKSQQVGKSGVSCTVVTALIETLEANELLKVKIHGSCPGELDDMVKQLEETTGSVAVSQIGRTVILYRPSLTKLKAEEKRKQAQRVHLKKQPMTKQSPRSKRPVSLEGQEPRRRGRGRRGSSRF